MVDQALTWAAIIASAGSIIALVKFWMDMGKAQQKADDTAAQAAHMIAKLELFASDLNRHKVEVAQNYATVRALNDVEQSFVRGLENLGNGINQRLDGMNTRLDNIIMAKEK